MDRFRLLRFLRRLSTLIDLVVLFADIPGAKLGTIDAAKCCVVYLGAFRQNVAIVNVTNEVHLKFLLDQKLVKSHWLDVASGSWRSNWDEDSRAEYGSRVLSFEWLLRISRGRAWPVIGHRPIEGRMRTSPHVSISMAGVRPVLITSAVP